MAAQRYGGNSASATRRQFGISGSGKSDAAQIGHSDTAIQTIYSATIRRQFGIGIGKSDTAQIGHSDTAMQSTYSDTIRRQFGISDKRHRHRLHGGIGKSDTAQIGQARYGATIRRNSAQTIRRSDTAAIRHQRHRQIRYGGNSASAASANPIRRYSGKSDTARYGANGECDTALTAQTIRR